jgi:hypothetical protein
MEALFFTATHERAVRIRSVDDLEDEPAAEPLRVDSPGAVVALAVALCGQGRGMIEQLRDATCQSFPVWSLSTDCADALSTLSDDAIDPIAEAWREKAGAAELDADLYELSTCLTDLRQALAVGRERGEQLFVLFEEKALS